MTYDDVDDLADDELLARLVQRGEDERRARWVVRHRDDPEVRRIITRMLVA